MSEQEYKILIETIKELIREVKHSESARLCKIPPYRFTFVFDWKAIIAISIGLLAIMDKFISNFIR